MGSRYYIVHLLLVQRSMGAGGRNRPIHQELPSMSCTTQTGMSQAKLIEDVETIIVKLFRRKKEIAATVGVGRVIRKKTTLRGSHQAYHLRVTH